MQKRVGQMGSCKDFLNLQSGLALLQFAPTGKMVVAVSCIGRFPQKT
jgi:hypothetical protein